jgi:tetratricopeptide (TPR) repeat protein
MEPQHMPSVSDVSKWAYDGKAAFERGRYDTASQLFRSAAQGYAELNDPVNAAEQKNNLGVTLLKLGRPQEALEMVMGTEQVFASIHDVRRQGMAVNNAAAAMEDAGRLDEALAAYERSAQLLAEAGEKELRSIALKAAAAIQLRRGKLMESGVSMIGVLESREHPSLWERLLKFLLRIVQR